MKAFQQDLRNGMTLEEALQKWGLTFHDAVLECHKQTSTRGVRNGEYHHIYKHFDGRYKVERQLRKKKYTLIVENLDDAVLIRDWLDTNGWNKSNVEKIKRKLKK